MNIELDITELGKLALDRDSNLRAVLHDYLDEVMDSNPEILWDLEVGLAKDTVRCIKCGYWVPTADIIGDECVDCNEE